MTNEQRASASVPGGLLIGNGRRPGSGPSIAVVDPSDGSVIAKVDTASVSDALDAVTAAHEAMAGWAGTPPRQRAEVLRRAFELMTARADWLARLIVEENGKSYRDAAAEVAYAAEFFRWYSEEAVRIQGTVETAPAGQNRIMVLRAPIGVCLLITPWNFPAAMATRKIGPALAAGCSVVLKPASETPLTALAIGDLLLEAGVPAGVVNVLPSASAGEFSSAVLADSRVRKVSFTGSTGVGRMLLAEAAKHVVKTSMELGGNAPFIVLDDADLDAAVAGALVAKMRNGGEACTAANRFYVHRSVIPEFSRRLGEAMGAMQVGPGLDAGTEVGPLVNESTQQKVRELVDEAVERGARVVTGGFVPDEGGYFYAPTVLDHIPAGARILQEEIFGPVAPIVAFDTDEEAVRLANDTEYGLVAYVYTRDVGRGLRLSERLESGMVGLNRAVVSDPAAPFGGVKQSGVGREGGHEGVLDYTESKYLALEWN